MSKSYHPLHGEGALSLKDIAWEKCGLPIGTDPTSAISFNDCVEEVYGTPPELNRDTSINPDPIIPNIEATPYKISGWFNYNHLRAVELLIVDPVTRTGTVTVSHYYPTEISYRSQFLGPLYTTIFALTAGQDNTSTSSSKYVYTYVEWNLMINSVCIIARIPTQINCAAYQSDRGDDYYVGAVEVTVNKGGTNARDYPQINVGYMENLTGQSLLSTDFNYAHPAVGSRVVVNNVNEVFNLNEEAVAEVEARITLGDYFTLTIATQWDDFDIGPDAYGGFNSTVIDIYDISVELTYVLRRPSVLTLAYQDVGTTTCDVMGEVIYQGLEPLTQKGVCYKLYSSSGDPTTSNSKVIYGDTELGAFEVTLPSLSTNTAYKYKAYAISSEGTSYGQLRTFTTLGGNVPTVYTENLSDLEQYECYSGGDATADGGYSITAKGVCWCEATSGDPTVSSSKTNDGSGLGSYVSHVTGLDYNTGYRLRAYATNSQGTGYGTILEFTTENLDIPRMTSSPAYDITHESAKCPGSVNSDEGTTVTERGICYKEGNIFSVPPTTSDTKVICGSGEGSFYASLTSLPEGTSYVFRAYGINSQGTGYGVNQMFSTDFED